MWTDKEKFGKKILNRNLKILVVGLGYVDLNIVCLSARSGFTIYGVDVDPERIKKLVKRENPIPEERWLTPLIKKFANTKLLFSTELNKALVEAEVIFIAVPTPVMKGKISYEYILLALDSISNGSLRGELIILESTVPPGATEDLIGSYLESKTDLTVGKDFGLAFSPERIDPGNERRKIWNIPKIVGGIDPLSTELACFLYGQSIETVIAVPNPKTAELVKVMENAQRDVNIAFTNLFAKTADKLGIDIEEALDAAETKWNFIKLKPGCGVGGKCIGDVAYMAIDSMRKNKISPALIEEARKINESMPEYTVKKLITALKLRGEDIRGCKVTILGLAYKGDCSRIKNSPSGVIIKILKGLRAEIVAYDPFVKNYQGVRCSNSLEEAVNTSDCVIVATDHSEFKNLQFDRNLVVIDGRNILERKDNYYGIGR